MEDIGLSKTKMFDALLEMNFKTRRCSHWVCPAPLVSMLTDVRLL